MKYNQEAKSLTFRRGSEVSHVIIMNIIIIIITTIIVIILQCIIFLEHCRPSWYSCWLMRFIPGRAVCFKQAGFRV